MAQYYRMDPVDLDEDRITEATSARLSALPQTAKENAI